MPVHHVPDDALLGYAAGSSSPGEELLVACHLTLCPRCRSVVERAERVGERALTRAAPVELPSDALQAILGRLDAPTSESSTSGLRHSAPPPLAGCSVFPAPLRRRIGPLDQLAWRGVGFEVRAAKVDLLGEGDDGQRVFLMDFPPSFQIPVHGHEGMERTLVLRGGFSDERAVFERGDVGWREDADHDVRIHPDGRCTTLFVNDGVVEVGWLTGLVDWWLHR